MDYGHIYTSVSIIKHRRCASKKEKWMGASRLPVLETKFDVTTKKSNCFLNAGSVSETIW